MQEKQAKEAAAAAASGNKGPKQTSGELRVAKGACPREWWAQRSPLKPSLPSAGEWLGHSLALARVAAALVSLARR